MSPQINNSGQIYVANGLLTVSTPNGTYLATGSPITSAGSFTCPGGGHLIQSFTPPVPTMGLIISGRNGISNKQILVVAGPGAVGVLDCAPNQVGQVLATFPGSLTAGCTVTIIDLGGGTEIFDFYWMYNIPNYGQLGQGGNNNLQVPLGVGQYGLITNNRVPVRIGDDSQNIQESHVSSTTTGSGTLIAAPGVGISLVLWESSVTATSTVVGAYAVITDGAVNLNLRGAQNDSNYRSHNVFHGGRKMPPNTGLNYFNNGCFGASFDMYYSTEVQVV